MSKAKVALAGSVGIASLLAGSAGQVARGEVITFQNGVNGYTGTFDRKIGATTSNDRKRLRCQRYHLLHRRRHDHD